MSVAVGGAHDASLRVASMAVGAASLSVDGVSVGNFTIPNTGGATTWQTVTINNVPLTSGTHVLRLTTTTGGYSVNWLRFAYAGAVDLIIDNLDTAYVLATGAEWNSKTASLGFYATIYSFSDPQGQQGNTFAFLPVLPSSGSYQVSLWWNVSGGAPRDNHIPVDIAHDDGDSTIYVDQTANGSRWNVLGTYDMAEGAGSGVTLHTDGTTRWVIADAARFERLGPPSNAGGTPPVITGQPSDSTVDLGSTATFTVSASGPGALTYQWRKNGVPIPGGGSSSAGSASLSGSAASASSNALMPSGSVGTGSSYGPADADAGVRGGDVGNSDPLPGPSYACSAPAPGSPLCGVALIMMGLMLRRKHRSAGAAG